MRQAWVLAVALLLLCSTLPVHGQTASAITVKSSEVNNGVVIITIQKGARTYELQCNQGMTSCNTLKRGDYTMIELPENWGMYDCKDVEVYPQSAQASDSDRKLKLGEYCLVVPK